MNKNYKSIEVLLKKNQKIAIWGMGGVGKTEATKVTFAKEFPQYDSVCFLENVREESKKFGLTHLRDKLLFQLLKEENFKSNVVGSSFTKRRINNKKVFIVLDDVNSFDQLQLYEDCGDIGPDSRLIITTRDKQLVSGRVDEIYELKNLNFSESLELFCLKAFKKRHPDKGYEDLSKRAIDYAEGIPLALKILGSHLCSKSHEFWESELSKLEKYPYEDIQNVLKVSYDGLDKPLKDIFLDIAFFFKEDYKDHVIAILNACDLYATSGVEVLVDKALITISYSNTIQMHDLLQEMGLEIVRQECERDPGKCSRLRDIEEVCDVLKNNKGTNAVEGITLDLSQVVDLQLSADAFNVMPNLRFLKVYISSSSKISGFINLPTDLKQISDKLRYLEWNGYPLKSLPPNFCAKLLVEIRMPHSQVKELWQGIQDLVNLEGIDLSECKQLTEFPDLSKAKKLKWVYLSGCESLSHLHSSILSLDTIVTLILDRCDKLRSLKSTKHLSSLQQLSVNGCSSLKEFAVSSDLIEKLDLSDTGIEILDLSIGPLSKLTWLNLEGLRLRNLPNELRCLTSLKKLKISDSELVIDRQKLFALFDGLRSLGVLHLKDCSNLFELPDNINVLSFLHELVLDGTSVETLPASIKHLQELEILSLENCSMLRFLPELPPFIKEFYAVNCTSLVTVSTIKTFAREMKGKDKCISFKNGLKLDAHSIQSIMEGALLTLMSATFHNVIVRRYSLYAHSYNYNSVKVCFPGRSVPGQFRYRSTGSSITVKLPSRKYLLGFFLSLVLSLSAPIKHGAEIRWQCYLADGKRVRCEGRSTWLEKAINDLYADHVFLWYDPYYGDRVLASYEGHVSFKFSIRTYTGEGDGLFDIKECGVRLICYSEFQSFLGGLDLELDKKVQLGVKLGLALDMEQGSPTEVEKRLLYALEHGSELYGSLTLEFESRRRAISTATEKYDEKESSESNESAGKESKASVDTKTSAEEKDRGESTIDTDTDTESTKAVKSKGNKENAEHSEENQGQIIVYSGIHDSVTAEERVHEKENEPIMDLDNPEGDQNESDEDPLAALERILSGSGNSSTEAGPSTSFVTFDVAVTEALHCLEWLLENSLESILSDVELQRQLQISLECIEQASEEKVSAGVMKLVRSMTSSVEDLFKNFAMTQKVVEDHTTLLQQKEKLVHQKEGAKKRQELLNEEMDQRKLEAERLDKEAEELDEKIRVLLEQKKTVELKQAKAKEALGKCVGEKKRLKDEAKNWVMESKELMSAIKDSESSYAAALSKQEKLNGKWEGLRTAFANNFRPLS